MKRIVALASALSLACTAAVLQAPTASAKTVDVTTTGTGTVIAATACPAPAKQDSDHALSNYTVLDGTASDGTFLYVIFGVPKGKKYYEKAGGTVLTRWNISGGVAAATCDLANNDIDLGHGNDITWVASYGDAGPALLVPRGVQNKRGLHSRKVVVVGTGDLNAITTLTFPHLLSGLCYSPGSGTYHYAAHFQKKVYLYQQDAKSRPVITKKDHSFPVHYDTTSGEQGLYCTDSAVFSVRSVADNTPKKKGHYYSYIYRYRWAKSTALVLRYDAGANLKKKNSVAREVESLFQVGTQYYIGVNRNDGGDDALYPISAAGLT